MIGQSRVSSRELEVLRLVAEGMTNKKIGEALGISPLTVKAHLERIVTRFGLESGERAGIVGHCFRTGLLI